MGFGEGELGFGAGVALGFEQIEAYDDAPEGVGRNLASLEQTLLDTGAVNLGDVALFSVEVGQDLFDGFEQVLGGDFAGDSFIGAGGCFGDAVSAVIIPPSLDGATGELAGLSFLIKEDHFANSLIASHVGVTLGVFEGSEDSRFQIVGDAFHAAGETGAAVVRGSMADSCCCKKATRRADERRCQIGHC